MVNQKQLFFVMFTLGQDEFLFFKKYAQHMCKLKGRAFSIVHKTKSK
jgi:hypothetical protein